MPILLLLVASFFGGVAVLLALFLLMPNPRQGSLDRRLEEAVSLGALLAPEAARPSIEIERGHIHPLMRPFYALGQHFVPSRSERLKVAFTLTQAGYRHPRVLEIFLGLKGAMATLGILVSAGVGLALEIESFRLVSSCLLVGIGAFYLPNAYVMKKVQNRKKEIFLHLPEILDLLLICLEAGLGLDAALLRVAREIERTSKVMSSELSRVNQEIRAGKPRADALRDFSRRNGVEDIQSFVVMLIQTDRLGTSLVDTLRVFNQSLRVTRRQRAEEAAAKLSVKLIFPLTFFIFPAFLVVLLGPALLKLLESLKVAH